MNRVCFLCSNSLSRAWLTSLWLQSFFQFVFILLFLLGYYLEGRLGCISQTFLNMEQETRSELAENYEVFIAGPINCFIDLCISAEQQAFRLVMYFVADFKKGGGDMVVGRLVSLKHPFETPQCKDMPEIGL